MRYRMNGWKCIDKKGVENGRQDVGRYRTYVGGWARGGKQVERTCFTGQLGCRVKILVFQLSVKGGFL